MGDLLQISPQELKFRFELKRNVPVTMSLTNLGDERVAFKVKTTSPKKYSVRPSTGVIEPGASKEIQVIMQAQREYPSSLSDCKDKFLVQATKVGKEVTDVNAELFEPGSAKEIRQSKLRVIMVGPPKPPSPVPEGVEEEASPPKATFSPDKDSRFTETLKDSDPNSEVAKLTRERNRLKDLLNKAEGDKSALTKRLEVVGQPNSSGLQTQKTLLEKGHYTLLHLAFFAFIAFIVGLMIGNRGS